MRELRLGLSVGLVGGLLLGLREAIVTLDANTFVQPAQYFWMYLAAPIVAGMGLGVLFLLPLALVRARRGRERSAAEALRFYGAAIGIGGAASVLVPWAGDVTAQLEAVGVPVGVPMSLGIWVVVGGLCATSAAAIAGAAYWYGTRSRHPLRWAAPASLALGLVLCWPIARFVASDWKMTRAPDGAAVAPASSPNLILISIDTLRADHLGSYGDPHGLTPHLDRLAADGVVFERAITSSPWTLPAMASLFTGRYPRHHGAGAITNRRDPLGRSALPEGSWTIATALAERGYRTHAIVTNPYLALRYGFGPGFGGYENLTIESEFFLAGRHTTLVRLLGWLRPAWVLGDRGEAVSARAARWLERVGSERPFFLWLHYIDPHPPYARAGVTRHKTFRADSLLGTSDESGTSLTLTSPDVARLRSGEIRLSAEQKEGVRALYRAEVASVDAAVGAVLEALDRRALRERTLVVCVGDHGEEFWEHGGVEHGHTLYDEVVRVPLLLRWPAGLPRGLRIDAVARMTDVASTVLDVLGLPPPTVAQDGTSLLPLVRGVEETPRVALSENLLFAEERVAFRGVREKYVRWESGKEEVYDLEHDPDELRDLAGLAPVVGPLRELAANVERGMTEAAVVARPAPPVGVDSLRALGYVR